MRATPHRSRRRETPPQAGRPFLYGKKRDYERAIRDCTKAIEILPEFVGAYYNRGNAWYSLKEYDKTWADAQTCRRLGGTPDAAFLESLAKATGRTE